MQKIKTTVSTISLDKKIDEKNYPETGEMNDKIYYDYDFRNRILQKSWFTVDVTLNKLADLISKGHSFCPAVFQENSANQTCIPKSTDYELDKRNIPHPNDVIHYDKNFPKKLHVWRNSKNFIQTRLIGVDIDFGYDSLEDIMDKINNSPFKDCSLIYTTFSYDKATGKIKVRLLWVLSEICTNPELIIKATSNLIKYFGGDESCKDVSRFFYGGKEILYINDKKEFDINIFLNLYDNEIISKTSTNKNTKNKEYRIIDDYVFDSETIVKNDKFISYLKNIGFEYSIDKKIVNFDWESALEKCKLLNKIQTKECTHIDIFNIATNLYWISGGLKWLKEQMDISNKEHKTDYNTNNYNILKEQRKMKYFPVKFNKTDLDFSTEYKNILEMGIPSKKYFLKQLNTPDMNKIKLKDAEKLFQSQFQKLIKTQPIKDKFEIHIFNPQTGLGKTKELETIPDDGFIIALPTHDLKDELQDRQTKLDDSKRVFKTIPLPNFSLELQTKINYYYSVGLIDKVNTLLNKVAKKENVGVKYTKEDWMKIKTYKFEMRQLFEKTNTILTTHNLAIANIFKRHHTIIFDEDPFNDLFTIKEISGSDLYNLRNSFEYVNNNLFKQLIFNILGKLQLAVGTEIVEMPYIEDKAKENIINELITNHLYSSDIYNFLFSDFVCLKINTQAEMDDVASIGMENALYKYGIRYVTKKNLPSKRIIILSATIQTEIYETAFGKENIFIHDIPFVQPKGIIIQDTRYTYTRSSLERTSVKNYISQSCNLQNPTISFKDSEYTNALLYFFNTRGYDRLKGKDINVIGTPELPTWAYILLAKAIGYNVRSLKQEYKEQQVQHNNFEFYFNTFTDKILQKLQLSLICTETIQATGRGRALRENNNIIIFSRIPIPGAKQKYLI